MGKVTAGTAGVDEKGARKPRQGAGIVARVNASLAEYQRMRCWFLWPEADFPRTAAGKPKLTEIRAAVESQWGTAEAGARSAATGGIAEMIARIRGASAGGKLSAQANLQTALNLSSLDRVELLGAIEHRYP